jgi:hypothetical protein
MPQRTGVHLKARHARIGKSLQRGAIARVGRDLLVAQPAHFAQAGILRHDTVAFAQNQVIALGQIGLGAQPEMIAVKNSENFHERKGTGDMNGRAVVGHPQNGLPQIGGRKKRGRGRHKI